MRPLDGIRVLAIENYVAGPYGSMMLADHGAEVIKVEPPGGDVYRSAEPVYENDQGESMSYTFLRLNRNKRSVVLDLKSEPDRQSFLRLVETADVVWENLQSGAFERLNLGWEVLRSVNPRLIYASLNGFGSPDLMPSPFQDRPAFDIVAQALSGVMVRVGEAGMPPMILGFPVADVLTGILAGYGVLLALNARAISGEGQRVNVSMYDAMIALNEQSIGHFSHFNEVPPRGKSGTSGPYGAFACRDGMFVVGVASNVVWARFCKTIERPDLIDEERLRHGVDRARNQEEMLRPLIEEWAATRTADEASTVLNEHGVPSAPIQDVSDLFHDPHVKAREMLVKLHDPALGSLEIPGISIKIASADRVEPRTAPQLGADQDTYLPR